jgi:ribosomal protein L16 Arg81 hydroxylase
MPSWTPRLDGGGVAEEDNNFSYSVGFQEPNAKSTDLLELL